MEFPLSLGNCLPYIANLQQGLATLVKGDGVSCAPFMGTAGCYMTESRRKNSRPWLLWPVLSALLALATPAAAVSVSGLYNADVPVQGGSSAALQQGYADGLRQVMVRVSGSRDVLQREGRSEERRVGKEGR